jgi:hypothetical protein
VRGAALAARVGSGGGAAETGAGWGGGAASRTNNDSVTSSRARETRLDSVADVPTNGNGSHPKSFVDTCQILSTWLGRASRCPP